MCPLLSISNKKNCEYFNNSLLFWSTFRALLMLCSWRQQMLKQLILFYFFHFTFPILEEVKASRFLKIKCQKFTESLLQVTQAFYICIHFTLYFLRFGSSSVGWPRIICIAESLTHADLVQDLKPYFTMLVDDADDLEIFLVDDFNKRQKLASTTNLPCEFCVKMT